MGRKETKLVTISLHFKYPWRSFCLQKGFYKKFSHPLSIWKRRHVGRWEDKRGFYTIKYWHLPKFFRWHFPSIDFGWSLKVAVMVARQYKVGPMSSSSSRISERKLRDRLEEGKKSDPYVVHYKMALFLVVENFIMLVCLPSCVIALMVLFDGTIKTK